MSADVVVINGSRLDDEGYRERAKKLLDNVYSAVDTLRHDMAAAGLDISGRSRLNQLLYAALALKDFHERRSRRVERGLRELLTVSSLSPEERSRVERVMAGAQHRTRDKEALSEEERALVTSYRVSDQAGRQTLRMVATALTERAHRRPRTDETTGGAPNALLPPVDEDCRL